MYLSLLPLAAISGLVVAQQVVLDDSFNKPVYELHPNLDRSGQWTVFNSTIKRVAVIGAGPAGLQAAATLVTHNFTVRLFDRAPGPGGNWLYSEQVPVRESYPDAPLDKDRQIPDTLPATKYYSEGDEGLTLDERWREHWQPRSIWNSLHTNSPAVITGLSEVPYPPDHSWVISAHTIGAHVRAYATIHSLNSNDESGSSVHAYSTRVEKLTKTPDNSTWLLTVRHLKRLEESNRIKATWWTEEFDAIVVASGPYDSPHVPDIEGLVQWSKVKSENPAGHSVYHSRVYRNPERYADKTVLVVGVGTSGSEIARDIAPFAKKLYASSKEYDWDKLHPFQRRSFRRFPSETEFIPQISSFKPLSSLDNGIRGGQIVLFNGSIILATGYRRANPFLLSVLGQEDANNLVKPPPSDVFTGSQLKNVHWTGHYIPDPTLAFTTVRPWTAGRYQSYGFAKVWEGTARLPNEAELWRQYNSTRFNNFRGLFGTGPSEALVRQYVTWLNNESLEHGGRLVAPWPVENREIFTYYANLEWESSYISQANFTRFENLPANEWSKDDIWDVSVMEDEFW
ncbi:FAD/NAD-P-binding domain-containing protein [Dendrothele bispora CBS 962.96]|uniref:FAD/NAD-P-binding domain-containing protein n=1 Tax=Dendrothele bispora (strain CBS 962.96) TaxID=1314807 RepID=A0A4S8L9I9_DENBC|nr:FAD/NAD-P-binding domain-containing protein [Dendrothele bispora CBS 962.96]